jgi:hypothetical protein
MVSLRDVAYDLKLAAVACDRLASMRFEIGGEIAADARTPARRVICARCLMRSRTPRFNRASAASPPT